MSMKNARKLMAEDVVDDIELDPKKGHHKNWDVLVAVAKFLRAHFDRENFKEFTSKATDNVGDDDGSSNLQAVNRGVKRKMSINDQEENGQKHVVQKGRRCTKACFEEDYLSDGEEEWGSYNNNKKNKSRGRSTSKKGGMKEKVPYPPPEMPIEFLNIIFEMRGTDIKLVIQKVLSNSDCKKDQNRLFISIRDAADFLMESEKDLLQSDAEQLKQSIDVVLLPPNFEKTNITLRQYNLQKPNGNVSRQYVLNKPWHDVVRTNGLAENTIIQIWSFRVNGQLGLAIVKLPEGEELVDVGKSTRTGGSNDTSTTSTGGATIFGHC